MNIRMNRFTVRQKPCCRVHFWHIRRPREKRWWPDLLPLLICTFCHSICKWHRWRHSLLCHTWWMINVNIFIYIQLTTLAETYVNECVFPSHQHFYRLTKECELIFRISTKRVANYLFDSFRCILQFIFIEIGHSLTNKSMNNYNYYQKSIIESRLTLNKQFYFSWIGQFLKSINRRL